MEALDKFVLHLEPFDIAFGSQPDGEIDARIGEGVKAHVRCKLGSRSSYLIYYLSCYLKGNRLNLLKIAAVVYPDLDRYAEFVPV